MRSNTKRVYQIKSLEQGLRPTKFKDEENDKQAKEWKSGYWEKKKILETKGEST